MFAYVFCMSFVCLCVHVCVRVCVRALLSRGRTGTGFIRADIPQGLTKIFIVDLSLFLVAFLSFLLP